QYKQHISENQLFEQIRIQQMKIKHHRGFSCFYLTSYGQYPDLLDERFWHINRWHIIENHHNCFHDTCFNHMAQKRFFQKTGITIKDESDCRIKCIINMMKANHSIIDHMVPVPVYNANEMD